MNEEDSDLDKFLYGDGKFDDIWFDLIWFDLILSFFIEYSNVESVPETEKSGKKEGDKEKEELEEVEEEIEDEDDYEIILDSTKLPSNVGINDLNK